MQVCQTLKPPPVKTQASALMALRPGEGISSYELTGLPLKPGQSKPRAQVPTHKTALSPVINKLQSVIDP